MRQGAEHTSGAGRPLGREGHEADEEIALPGDAFAARLRAVRTRRLLDRQLAELKLGKRIGRPLLIVLALAGALFGLPAAWVFGANFADPPGGLLMLTRVAEGRAADADIRISHIPVPLAEIDEDLIVAVIAVEDPGFCRRGDPDADPKTKARSRLTTETARTLFLWPSRTMIGKAAEGYFASLTDGLLSKQRVMELYLTHVEWGDGVFGAEAAAQRHYGKSARDLSEIEAVRLALILRNPRGHTPTREDALVRNLAPAKLAEMRQLRALDRAAPESDPGHLRCVLTGRGDG